MKRVEKDYEELLRLFNSHGVKYCIIGAFAVAFYTIPRYTKDMDILVEPARKNGERIMNALKEFGFGRLKLSVNDFVREGRIIQLGYEPVRVDILTSINGCTFEEVWKNKTRGRYGTEKVYFIGLGELIKNKRSTRRKQDKVDIDLLMIAKRRMGSKVKR
ncbi:MAG: hypothetical protein HY878_00385 [Deltaproteobacteria bacterium]|nr:hypothetical protein [Deltaproteobacteria bacterium]